VASGRGDPVVRGLAPAILKVMGRLASRPSALAVAALLVALAGSARPAAAESLASPAPLPDRGIFPELGAAARLVLPSRLAPSSLRATFDRGRGVLVLYEGDDPVNAYAVAAGPGAAPATLAALLPRLGPRDAAELGALPAELALLAPDDRRAPRSPDADGDGIPDRLDVLLGARKLVENHATYTEGYFKLAYPGGDVPRTIGVCTDTIVRAFRNAGLDLQKLVAEDVRRARAAYPLIKRPDSNIDHRRVRNLALWFERHVRRVPAQAPPRPGDVVFFDTFPRRSGPDHVGIVSDRLGPSGQLLVINNWTEGTVEAEMDLLPWVPVTDRYRLP
jgi:uncharacterized protein YijF (DUF1287 family)